LLNAVEDAAKARGLWGVVLSIFIHVPWNAPHYRRCGFSEIADEELIPALLAIRREYEAQGLDERQWAFMYQLCRQRGITFFRLKRPVRR